MDWQKAQDVKKDIINILNTIDLPYIRPDRVFCYRTTGSKVRAYARTWSMPKIFQDALGLQPAYVIEVLSDHFDKLDDDERKKVLIHELLHIPKNFSGALLPHRTRSRNLHQVANKLFKEYKSKTLYT